MGFDYDDYDYDYPDAPVDETVTYECEDCDETWHPEVVGEYQGEAPHGGTVYYEADDADLCPSCGKAGKERG